MRADSLRAELAKRGMVITDEDLDRMRARLAALPPISEERHAERLAWLEQFDRPNRCAS